MTMLQIWSIIQLYPEIKKDGSSGRFHVMDVGVKSEPSFIDNKISQIINSVNSSKVVDENGEPLVVYHGTNAVFSKFQKGDTGFHFGDKTAAENRISDTNESSRRLIEVFLNVRHALSIESDLGDWNGSEIADFILV